MAEKISRVRSRLLNVSDFADSAKFWGGTIQHAKQTGRKS
jgi:hypothetical protein